MKTRTHDRFYIQTCHDELKTISYFTNLYFKIKSSLQQGPTLLFPSRYTRFFDYTGKRSGETLKDLFSRQLVQIPRVTEEIATAITQQFPTPANLILALQTANDRESCIELLKNIPLLSGNNHSKKVGKAAAEALIQLYCHL